MLACIDELRLAPGITAPKDKHQVLLILAERLDGSIGKLLPAFALMARSLMGTNGQRGVEQQYSLFCPASQISRSRGICADVGFDFFEYIADESKNVE